MPQFRADIGVTEKAVTTAQGILIGTQTTMPQPSVYNVGCTVKYVGSAGTYTPGRYYTCVQDGAGYAWQEAAVIATGLDLSQGSRVVATDANGMAIATDVTAVELGYLGGVTSALQGQLNGKVPTSRTINGKALTDNITLSAGDIGAAPASAVLEASRALQSSSNGEVSVSNVTSVELSYLSGVTSAIQSQLNNKANKADIPTLLSQLTNDTGFVTNAVSDLINYYTKANTYTKAEVNNLISAIPKFSIQVVQSLPSSGISTTTIYLVPKTASTNDSYDEYIYVNNTWEKIGSTAVSLDDYYTKAQVNAMVTPIQSATGITINGVALQAATASQQGLMTVAQVGQLATAVSNAQSALNGNVTGGTFSTDSSGNLTLTLNRTAGALNIGPTALTAAKAVADGSGNNIASTYATQSALSSGLAGKADAGTEITGGAFSDNLLILNKQDGSKVDIPFDIQTQQQAYFIEKVSGYSVFGTTPIQNATSSSSESKTATSCANWDIENYASAPPNLVNVRDVEVDSNSFRYVDGEPFYYSYNFHNYPDNPTYERTSPVYGHLNPNEWYITDAKINVYEFDTSLPDFNGIFKASQFEDLTILKPSEKTIYLDCKYVHLRQDSNMAIFDGNAQVKLEEGNVYVRYDRNLYTFYPGSASYADHEVYFIFQDTKVETPYHPSEVRVLLDEPPLMDVVDY